MPDKPKPYRTRHREINEAALEKVENVRKLMTKLVYRIQPRDEEGMKLAEQIADALIGALSDLRDEQRILDNGGIDVAGMQQENANLHERCKFLEREVERHGNLMTELALRQDLVEEKLQEMGVPIELPQLKSKEAKK